MPTPWTLQHPIKNFNTVEQRSLGHVGDTGRTQRHLDVSQDGGQGLVSEAPGSSRRGVKPAPKTLDEMKLGKEKRT